MTLLSIAITDDDDDGFDDGSSWLNDIDNYSNSDVFRVKDNGSTVHQGGVRFRTVTIPQGATINSATITMKTKSGLNNFTSMIIYGDNVDTAALWSNSSRPASGFSDTTAGTLNTTMPTAGNDLVMECAACVQDIVNRGGWSSGNHMRFRLLPDDSYAQSTIYDFDGSHSNEAVLDIDYTAGGGGATGKSNPLLGPLGGSLAGAIA